MLIDRDLELIPPSQQFIERLLEVCRDPQTVREMPNEASISRETLEQFLKVAPDGHQAGDPPRGWLPSYHFWMKTNDHTGQPTVAGGIGLRIGTSNDIELYTGNVGYHVYPPYRGRRFAERSCKLLVPLARRHGMKTLWITCNPENAASRRTLERLGGVYVNTIPVPADHAFHARGETQKSRYRFDL